MFENVPHIDQILRQRDYRLFSAMLAVMGHIYKNINGSLESPAVKNKIQQL